MRKTENTILTVLSWLHTVLLFGSVCVMYLAIYKPEEIRGIILFRHGIFLLIPVVLSYLYQRKIKNLVLYILIAGGSAVILYIVTGDLLLLICGCLIYWIRCYTRLVKGRISRQMREFPGEEGKFCEPELWEIPTFIDKPKAVHWLIILVMYFILILGGHHDNLKVLFYMLVLEVMVTFLYQYIDQMKQYILGKQKMANLPARTILRNGYTILLPMTVILMLAFIPSISYGREPLTRLYHTINPNIATEAEVIEMPDECSGNSMMTILEGMLGEERETPAWLIYLSDTLSAVTTLLLLFALVWGMIKGIGSMMHNYGEDDEDEIIDLKAVKEEQKRVQKQRKKEESKQRQTLEYQIRRYYKKVILRDRNSKPRMSETPEEIECHTELRGISDPESFHEIYEKARYSKDGVTEIDYERIHA